jgi:hypothetical protein
MNALSNVSMRAIPNARTDAHPAKTIALFWAHPSAWNRTIWI